MGFLSTFPALSTAGSLLLARCKSEMRKTWVFLRNALEWWLAWWEFSFGADPVWAKGRGLPGTVTPRGGKDCQ